MDWRTDCLVWCVGWSWTDTGDDWRGRRHRAAYTTAFSRPSCPATAWSLTPTSPSSSPTTATSASTLPFPSARDRRPRPWGWPPVCKTMTSMLARVWGLVCDLRSRDFCESLGSDVWFEIGVFARIWGLVCDLRSVFLRGFGVWFEVGVASYVWFEVGVFARVWGLVCALKSSGIWCVIWDWRVKGFVWHRVVTCIEKPEWSKVWRLSAEECD